MNNFYSILENVKVSFYTMEYDDTNRVPFLVETAIADKIPGHLQDLINSPENDINSVHERDRIGRYRFVFKSHPVIDKSIKTGIFIRIQQYKHPDTNAWVDASESEQTQYVVRDVSNIFPGGRWKAFNMVEKDLA